MALDTKAQAILDKRAASGLPATHTLSPAQSRTNSRLTPAAYGPEVGKVEDILVSGCEGKLTARVYTPEGEGPFPILVWFHGGGWVTGDLDREDGTARHLTVETGCIVVSVDYRLAPETKFPGPVEDCYGATLWVSQNTDRLNGKPGNLAVGGSSAGGNLAAAVSIMARDRSGPALGVQVLVYPVTDRDFSTDSYKRNGEGYLLTKDSMMWYWDHYLDQESDALNPYAAPLQAKDLSGLPAALVITAEYDPLCDEGKMYADKLEMAGVSTDYVCYDGMIHGFFGMANDLDQAKEALKRTGSLLKKSFVI